MESKNKKNSAVKKVDEITEKAEIVPSVEEPTEKPAVKTVKKQTTANKDKKKPVAKKQTNKNAKQAHDEKAAKRAEAAEMRLKAKEERAEKKKQAKEKKRQAALAKKQAAEKKRAAAKQAKKRKAESVKALKIKKREERLAKKEALKHETKEAREKRIAAEKQAKLKLKADKAAKKAEFKKQQAAKRADAKRQKTERKDERKRVAAEKRAEAKQKRAERRDKQKTEKRKRGIGGWLAAVISLGCTVLILGSLLTLSIFTDYIDVAPTNDSRASARSFYDFVGYVDSMETNMSKVFVSSDEEGQQRLLGEIVVQSNLADSALGQLPIADESKYYTSKYINQVGDYCKYLNNRLIAGGDLTAKDMENLNKLYEINVNLKGVLSTLSAGIDENYDFKTLADNNANDAIIAQFNTLEKSAAEYPQMIYDGAFSDGLDALEAKGVHGEEINEQTAIERFNAYFKDYGIEKVEVTGKTENTKIESYNILAQTKEGGDVFAQFTVKGGDLLMFTAHRDCGEDKISDDEALASAVTFLNSLGFDTMTCVWRYNSSGVEYFNFANLENGVVVYPDLVKVTVCRETGRVTGMSAEEYYLNHTARGKFTAKHTMTEATEAVNGKLDIVKARKVIVPVGNGNEEYAYEFEGTAGEDVFYVFINADTLKEIKIYKAVNTAEGRLLV